jgi:TRAP-type C4-dicarboxylate transport system permease small subunit
MCTVERKASMEVIQKTLLFVSEKLKMVGAVFLIGMALLTCLDVIGRLFKYPIFGTVELVSFMGAIAIACSLPFTHQEQGHIGVELFTRKLSSKVRHTVELCTELLSLALFILVSWRMFDFSISQMESGVLSMNLQLPEYAIIFIVACGFVIFTLTIINSIFQTLGKLRK